MRYRFLDNYPRRVIQGASILSRAELGPTIQQVKSVYDGVEKWAKTEKAHFTFEWFAMSPAIRKEPKGLVLIISPFNFPLFTLFGPAVCIFSEFEDVDFR